MDVFGSTLGGEAGDMALKFMPRGGVYIMGKIPAANVQVMASRRVKTLGSGEKMRLGFMVSSFYFMYRYITFLLYANATHTTLTLLCSPSHLCGKMKNDAGGLPRQGPHGTRA